MKCDLKIGVNVDTSDLDKVEAQLKRILELQKQVNDANQTNDSYQTVFRVKGGAVFVNGANITSPTHHANSQNDLLRNLIEEAAKDFLAKQLRPGGALWQEIKNR